MSGAGGGRERPRALCVVHLVRSGAGTEPLGRFLTSYREHPAGVEHDLVLLYKGFDSASAAAEHRELAGDLPVEELFVSDQGFDLTAYATAADSLNAARYCFLNSHARILAANWLTHLDSALSAPGAGLAGASGSWASIVSYGLFHLGLPSAYRRVYGDRRSTVRAFAELDRERTGTPADISAPRRSVYTALSLAGAAVGFERFPAHHLRTNAFIIDHGVFAEVGQAALRRKVQAHRLESGRDSITRRVERLGLDALVVDRDGLSYAHADWPSSETFWQGAQGGLLVADNQSEDYQRAGSERRLLLSRYAWGDQAAPR
jgi:hypothetical protein